MRHFYVVRDPSGRFGAARRGGLALARAAVPALLIACVLPCHAGTIVRGRVHLPSAARVTNTDGTTARQALDARDAVVFVTVAPGENAKKLGGRARRADVEIQGDRFTPRVLPVMMGSKVRFHNRDRIYHAVFSVSPEGRFDLGNLAPGQTRETRLQNSGVVNLFCQLHPATAGFVVVCPNWYFVRAGSSGEFRLPELKRGAYVIHAWHPRLGEIQRSVAASGRGAVELNLRY